MEGMPWLFDANHLEHWADDRSAQDFLPRLVRQLIHGLTDSLQRIVFPAGSSVQLGGWDGIVESSQGNEFVPPGVSGWELSTQKKGKKGKADDDYEKRSEDPRGLDLFINYLESVVGNSEDQLEMVKWGTLDLCLPGFRSQPHIESLSR